MTVIIIDDDIIDVMTVYSKKWLLLMTYYGVLRTGKYQWPIYYS